MLKMTSPFALFSAAGFLVLYLSSCGPAPLEARGTVKYWTNRPAAPLMEAAAELPEVQASALDDPRSWGILIRTPGEAPDLAVTDLNQDLTQAAGQDLLLTLSDYVPRMKSTGEIWPGLMNIYQDFPHFVPSHLYLWQLMAHGGVLKEAGLSFPSTLEDLETAFSVLKSRGIVPLALGASFGWPALGLLAQVDIRLNGEESYRKTLKGQRPLDDPGLMPVYLLLEKWRDQGWINTDAGDLNWSGALQLVREGKAAFTFQGMNAFVRLGEGETFQAASLPGPGTGGKPGDLAVIQGFALSRSAAFPEAALALADRTILNSRKAKGPDSFRISALRPAEGSIEDAPALHRTQILQMDAAAAGAPLLPQLDRVLPPQAAYDANLIIARFFQAPQGMSAEELASALGKLELGGVSPDSGPGAAEDQ